MHIVKSILYVLSSLALSSLAFSSVMIITASLTVTNPDIIKSWPLKSGFYENIIEIGMGQIVQTENGQEVSLDSVIEESALDKQVIMDTITNQFSPEYVETKANIFIDSIYDWLEGKTDQLTFELSLADKSDDLILALTNEVEKQLADLPICNPGQITPQFDVLGATCLPPGITPAIAADQLEKELTSDDSVLGDLSFSDKDLFAESTQQTDSQEQSNPTLNRSDFENIPDYYVYLKNASLILGAVLVLLVVIVTLTGKTILKGLRRAGQTIFSAGLVTWIGFFLTNRFSGSLTLSNLGDSKEAEITNKIIAPLFSVIIKDVSLTGIWVSLVVVIVGIIIWLVAFILDKVHHHHEAEQIALKAAAGIGASHPQLTGAEAKLPEPTETLNNTKTVDPQKDISASQFPDNGHLPTQTVTDETNNQNHPSDS